MDTKNNKTLIHINSNYFNNIPKRALFCCELTYYCTLNCPYCYQKNHNSKEKLNLKIFDKIIQKIILESKKIDFDYIQINIQGGELTELDYSYNKNIFNLINKYKNIKKLELYFLTNFSFNIDKFINDLKKTFNQENTVLLITIHPFLKKIKNEDKIINDIKKLIENNIQFKIQFFNQFRGKLFKNLFEYLKLIKKINFIDSEINHEQIIQEITFKDLDCFCLPFEYTVTPQGEIFDNCRKIKYNFLNFKFKDNWIKCNLKNCHTAKDFYQNKKVFNENSKK